MNPFTFSSKGSKHQEAFKRWLTISTLLIILTLVSLWAVTKYQWTLLHSYQIQQQELHTALQQLNLYQQQLQAESAPKHHSSLVSLLDLISNVIPDKVRLHRCNYHRDEPLLLSGYAIKQSDVVTFVRNLAQRRTTNLRTLQYDAHQKGYLFTLAVALDNR